MQVVLSCYTFGVGFFMTVNFYLNNKINKKTDDFTVLCFVSEQNKRISLGTSIKIKDAAWNKEKQKVKSSYAIASEVNQTLSSLKSKIEKIERDAKRENPFISADTLFELIKSNYQADAIQKRFYQYYDEFLDFQKNTGRTKPVQPSVLMNYKSVLKKLIEFEKHAKIRLNINTINFEVLNRLTEFLNIEVGYNHNSVVKTLKSLAAFLRWCNDMNYTNNKDYKKVKVKEYVPEIIVLTEDEVSRIAKLELNEKLDCIRDTFLFACYTGQRFEDIANFQFDNVSDGCWNLITRKTNDHISVPLSNSALKIIDKYKKQGLTKLATVNNQTTNDGVRKIASLAEINDVITTVTFKGGKRIEARFPKHELITFHVARKTYITLSLIFGLPVPMIMEISGHKDYTTMKRYIAISKKTSKSSILEAWNKREF